MTTELKLEPGWLRREFDDITALERAQKKILLANDARRKNGYTQPGTIEFTMKEVKALAYMIRCAGLTK